jgi:hypothetical protein
MDAMCRSVNHFEVLQKKVLKDQGLRSMKQLIQSKLKHHQSDGIGTLEIPVLVLNFHRNAICLSRATE